MFEKRIALGASRRREGMSKKKILWFSLLLLLIFLSIWQMPISQTEISENITLPTPTEIK
jgi:ABC-type nitrate/sulfonate/bicarbonate transport system permease component